jgi:calcineurin-like phosphoesterase family protein
MKNLYKHPNEPKWFVTSDLHMDHPDILKHNPTTRPFKTLDEMHECIVDRWNSTVRKNDYVVIVGDLAFKNFEKWARILRGKKFLVLGDHDSVSLEAQKCFLKVSEGLRKTIFGRRFYFHHYACVTWPDQYEGSCMVHGHSHGRLEEFDYVKRCDVSMDAWDLRVIPIEVLFEVFDMKKSPPPMTQEERYHREKKKKLLIQNNHLLLERYDKEFKV